MQKKIQTTTAKCKT